jgi:hypothetical protein
LKDPGRHFPVPYYPKIDLPYSCRHCNVRLQRLDAQLPTLFHLWQPHPFHDR